MNLRVWWIPQVPMEPFHVEVQTLHEAKLILTTLAKYDLFQYEKRVKGDYANAGGLEVLVGSEWEEWDDGEGNSIDDVMRAER